MMASDLARILELAISKYGDLNIGVHDACNNELYDFSVCTATDNELGDVFVLVDKEYGGMFRWIKQLNIDCVNP